MSDNLQIKSNNKCSEIHSHEVIELNCPATTIEHPTDVTIGVPYEFNSLPMACYDKHIKDNQAHIYYLNAEKTRYVKIMPTHNDKINGEFEERLLFAFLSIAHHQKEILNKSSISNIIITTIPDVVKALGLKYHGTYKKRITDSLSRLKRTGYEFKDCYYNSTNRKITSLYDVSIVASFKYISHIDVNQLDPVTAALFTDRRIKDFLVVTLDEGLITNFINKKGYLLYSASKLLSIESGIARKIYMYCDRNRWGLINDLIFNEKITVLAHIIPIMTKDFSKIAKIIQNSLKELLQNKLIINYKFHKETPTKNSWIEVHFAESRKHFINHVPVQHVHVHSKEIINVETADEQKNDKSKNKIVFHLDIISLFNGITLQSSTIKLINDLYNRKGLIHIKALMADVEEKADNYDSYIFKMLSSNKEPKWYETNQAKYLKNLIKEHEDLVEKENKTNKKKELALEYQKYSSNDNKIQNLKLILQNKINNRLNYLKNNPPKWIEMYPGGIEKYLESEKNRYNNYQTQEMYLFYIWLIENVNDTIYFEEDKNFKNFRKELFNNNLY
jgi:hypothetical protein